MTTPRVTLIVVSFEMGRELPRTLTSLSPRYQDCAAGDYEILVVDNGSTHPPSNEDFANLGADIQVFGCSSTSRSPVKAINEGLARARGDLIGVWIDGARMASPGLVKACLAASTLHPRPVIATHNYQLGPKLQALSSAEGYDQAAEDELLKLIRWPQDGYLLFDISAPEIRAWPKGNMLESNALFLPRAMWQELRGYDEQFDEPGGGVANPDMLIRAVGLPGAQLIRILGEGTFHQIHGGLTTSDRSRAMNALKIGSRSYLRSRGKPLVPVRISGWIYNYRTGEVLR